MNKFVVRLVIALTALSLIGLLFRGPGLGGAASATKHRLKGTQLLFQKQSSQDDVHIPGETRAQAAEAAEDAVKVDNDNDASKISQEHSVASSPAQADAVDEDTVHVEDTVPERPQDRSAHLGGAKLDDDVVHVANDEPESSEEHAAPSSSTSHAELDEDTVQIEDTAPERPQQQSARSGGTKLDEDTVQVANDEPESSEEHAAPSSSTKNAEPQEEPSRHSSSTELDEDTVQIAKEPVSSSIEIGIAKADAKVGDASESFQEPAKAVVSQESPAKPPSQDEQTPDAVEGFSKVEELPTRPPAGAQLAPIPTGQPALLEAEEPSSHVESALAGHVSTEPVSKLAAESENPAKATGEVISEHAESPAKPEATEVASPSPPQVAGETSSPLPVASLDTGQVHSEGAVRAPEAEPPAAVTAGQEAVETRAEIKAELPAGETVVHVQTEAPAAEIPSSTATPVLVEGGSAAVMVSNEVSSEPAKPETGEVKVANNVPETGADVRVESEDVQLTDAASKAETPAGETVVHVQTEAPAPVTPSSTEAPVTVEGSATIMVANEVSSEPAKPGTSEVKVANNLPEPAADVRVESEDVQLTDAASESGTSPPADGTMLQKARSAVAQAEAGLTEAEKELAQTGGQMLEQVQKAAAAGKEVFQEVEEESSAIAHAVEKAVVNTGNMLSGEADQAPPPVS